MEHLTKQQIVLLTLLVSFVTSLSTGIVTVSLMDQAPSGVTRTINQVIERTIQQAAPQNASVGTVSINVDDQVSEATSLVASSTVKIKNVLTNNVVGLGLIISKNGLIITDKKIINTNQSYTAILSDGTNVSLSPSLSYTNDVLAFLTPATIYANNVPVTLTPIHLSSTLTLGQKILSLTGSSSLILADGLVNQLDGTTIITSISPEKLVSGSPLFDVQGNVVGLQGSSILYQLAPLIPSGAVL